ncbi:MAG TPA: DJ-1 family glyoxalase III [Rectinemataceae bacterium]
MKKACLILAEGFEEVEAVTPVDYLRRAGVEVTVAGLGGTRISGGHGIVIEADLPLSELASATFDALIVPGGMKGAERIARSAEAKAFVQRHFASGALLGAICAAPAVVLHRGFGILKGRRFTCYPGMEEEVEGATFTQGRVVVDGNLITSRGPGTAGEFALALVSALAGKEAAAKLAAGTLLMP